MLDHRIYVWMTPSATSGVEMIYDVGFDITMRSSGIGRPQGRGQAGEIMCRAGLELTAQAQASTSIGI